MVHLLARPAAHAAVGAAGLISLVACFALAAYMAFLYIRARRNALLSVNGERAIRFFKSQPGIFLTQLLLADCLQALGFALSFHWAIGDNAAFPEGQIPAICTFQAVLIQLGDVGVAFFTLAIAIHTFCLLVLRRRPSDRAVLSLIPLTWFIVLALATVGPLFLRNARNERPFYCGSNDAYCWISPFHSKNSVPLHLVFILSAAFGSAIFYPIIFMAIRFRPRVEEASMGVSGTTSTSSRPKSEVQKRMDLAAQRMLYFPVAYLMTSLPLIVYRLAALNGHKWSWQTLTAVGTLFALNGAVDVALYTWTRSLVSSPKTHSAQLISSSNVHILPYSSPTLKSLPGASFDSTGKDAYPLQASPAGSPFSSPITPFFLSEPIKPGQAM